MAVCDKTGKKCLALEAALSIREGSLVTRLDGTVDLEADETRMQYFDRLLENGKAACAEGECGVLAYAAAISLDGMARTLTAGNLHFRTEDEKY